jgi:SAM-dependent methyltransferase
MTGMWQRGDCYEQYVGIWSRRVASSFLAWLDIPPRQRWLDVGCGTGALCAAILERCAPTFVVGVEPSAEYLDKAKEQLGSRVTFHRGTADAIPLEGEAVDVTCSALMLNFVPDERAALAEMTRVTATGGTIAAYVWDYAGKMELMRCFWDAARELDPEAKAADEGVRFPSCNAGALKTLFTGAGLQAVDVTAIDIETPFASFDAYWEPFLGAQGPAPAYAMSLEEPARERLRERLKERLPIESDGSIELNARAWAVRGRVKR